MIIKPVTFKCPNCNELYNYISFISGNTIGAIYYSDGFILAPMYPNVQKLTKCGICDQFFWLKDENIYSDENIFSKTSDAPQMTVFDYIEYLEVNPTLSPNDELYIRQQIRFLFNHTMSNEITNKVLYISNQNLWLILDLYYRNYGFENNLFTIAEIYRNLKQFDKSIELFNKFRISASENEKRIVDKLIKLAMQKNDEITEI